MYLGLQSEFPVCVYETRACLADTELTHPSGRHVLDAMGSHVALVGPDGAGTALKLTNQLLVGAHAAAAAEALAFAQAAGVDLGVALKLLAVSWGDSKILQRVGGVILAAQDSGGADARVIVGSQAPLRLITKDLAIVADTAAARGLAALPVTNSALQAFLRERDALGHADSDMATLFYTLKRQ